MPDENKWLDMVGFVPKAMITANFGQHHWELDQGGFVVEKERVQANKFQFISFTHTAPIKDWWVYSRNILGFS